MVYCLGVDHLLKNKHLDHKCEIIISESIPGKSGKKHKVPIAVKLNGMYIAIGFNKPTGHAVSKKDIQKFYEIANDVKDGGSHLAYEMMNHLNRFRNKNYYDETTGGCHKAMDKIIELYKENEHGTELVKDIERVLNLQTREDEYTPSSRAKEYLKQTINLIKGM